VFSVTCSSLSEATKVVHVLMIADLKENKASIMKQFLIYLWDDLCTGLSLYIDKMYMLVCFFDMYFWMTLFIEWYW
jgi:hypothetical protein